MSQPEVSLIITTYNRPRALDRVLASVAAQQRRPEETIVADDGSTADTAAIIERWRAQGLALRHVWQADQGFRAGMARNRACAGAEGDLLVFLDGDCLALPDFVGTHVLLAEKGWFVAGNRVLLSRELSEAVEAGHADPLQWTARQWLAHRFDGQVNRLLPLARMGDAGWRRRSPDDWKLARTCNLAVWRSDFLRVNGFDERFDGWGFEDSDFAVRLIRSGVKLKSGRLATGVLHLWHPENDRERASRNRELLDEALRSDRVRAIQGVTAYLGESR